ncbi:MAG: LysM peptidoglycan-binding domain-containing protein [Bdellovibrionales bacterium]
MKKLASQIIVISFFTGPGLAQEFYVVKSGDVLSQIVQNKYPSERIYGAKGKLAEVKKLNPRILNLNVIYPNQKIYFTPATAAQSKQTIPEEESLVAQAPEEKAENKRDVSELNQVEEWNISALYGAKYLSISQSGALVEAKVGDIYLNNLKLNSEFHFEDWSFGVQFDSYKFKYKTLTAGDSQQMYAVNLYGSYGWFLGGLNIEQNPLFRNNNGNIEMTKMTLMSLSLGAKKDIELPTRKPTVLKLKGWLSYPLSASSDNADIKLNSITGYGIHGEVELDRQIFVKNDYSLHATWVGQVGTQRINQQVKWDTSEGESKSNIVNASTSLGILFKF